MENEEKFIYVNSLKRKFKSNLRSDDIDPMNLVSDPDYFFNIWRDEYLDKLKKEKEEYQETEFNELNILN